MQKLPILGMVCLVLLAVSLFALVSCSKDKSDQIKSAEGVREVKEEKGSKPAAYPVQAAFVKELVRCAPPGAKSDDHQARDKAAALLRDSLVLKDAAKPMVLWGGRPASGSYHPSDYSLTEFSWFVYSNMYLSLFTFNGEHTITEKDGYTILSAQCEFRGDLEPGAYPYPFWHKPAKWTAYEVSKHLDFVFQNDKLIAIYRVNEPDAKPRRQMKWDGKWSWTDQNGKEQPYNTLYDYMLSKENPHREALDKAYRSFALEARNHNCMSCHAPDNPDKMGKLSLLNYPNQALSHRHEIMSELDNNTMPPKTKEHPSGIQDGEKRAALLKLAEAFSEAGDKALKFEEERVKKN
ncbi:MAG TPA: hypothetical protein VEJ63_19520 [Planctomycetota bacterium]|nr:hypothetical protein [Planctomycetota bacterium]